MRSALNRLSFHRCGLGFIACETSQVLLAGGQVDFLGDLRSPIFASPND